MKEAAIDGGLDRGIIPPSGSELLKAEVSFSETLNKPLTTPNFIQRTRKWALPYLLTAGNTFLAIACGTAVRAGDSPTVPEATAEAFTQQNPDASQVNIPGVGKVGLEPAPQSEPPKSPEEKVAEVRQAQQEALAKNQPRIPRPQEVIDNGGKILDTYISVTGAGMLAINMPPNKNINMPSLTDGVVVDARRINSTTNVVVVQSGNRVWHYLSPRISELSVKKGDNVILGSPLYQVQFDPESDVQGGFQTIGDGLPEGTVTLIGTMPAGSNQPEKLTLENGILKDKDGKPLAIPTLASAPSDGKG